MRVALLGHKNIPSREGGVEVVVTELATRMANLGHDVTVYGRATVDRLPGEVDYQGVRIRTVRTLDAKGLSAVTSSYNAVRAAIADNPDVIHFHAEGPCAMLPIARRAGIRTVATIHGLDWRRAKWGPIASSYIKLGERIAAAQAEELIVLSRNMQGYFEGAYGRSSHYIPNGIDEKNPESANLITTKYGLKKDSYILYVGRIVPEKCLHRLVEAYRGLHTDKALVVAGVPSDSRGYYDEVRSLAANDSRVHFIGFSEGLELAELYSNAFMYVLPSELEGMPMSLLEAMAYGCCCVVSDIPECVEVLKGAGVSYHRGDTENLRAVMGAIIEDPNFADDLGNLAKLRVKESFGWDSVVEQTLAVYRGDYII